MKTKEISAGDIAQVVECLPSMHKGLGSISSIPYSGYNEVCL